MGTTDVQSTSNDTWGTSTEQISTDASTGEGVQCTCKHAVEELENCQGAWSIINILNQTLIYKLLQ